MSTSPSLPHDRFPSPPGLRQTPRLSSCLLVACCRPEFPSHSAATSIRCVRNPQAVGFSPSCRSFNLITTPFFNFRLRVSILHTSPFCRERVARPGPPIVAWSHSADRKFCPGATESHLATRKTRESAAGEFSFACTDLIPVS